MCGGIHLGIIIIINHLTETLPYALIDFEFNPSSLQAFTWSLVS